MNKTYMSLACLSLLVLAGCTSQKPAENAYKFGAVFPLTGDNILWRICHHSVRKWEMGEDVKNLHTDDLNTIFFLQQENLIAGAELVFFCEFLWNSKTDALSPSRQRSLMQFKFPEFLCDFMQLIHPQPRFSTGRALEIAMFNVLRRQAQ